MLSIAANQFFVRGPEIYFKQHVIELRHRIEKNSAVFYASLPGAWEYNFPFRKMFIFVKLICKMSFLIATDFVPP